MHELFEQTFQKYEKDLFLVAVSILHNTEDARDAVQEAALAAFRAYGRLKNKEYFKTWITRIVINKSKDILRHNRRHPTEELTDELEVFSETPEEDMEIMDAICRMDPKLALYITLRFYRELTYEETAAVLLQSVSKVKYQTKKALNELKHQLEGD